MRPRLLIRKRSGIAVASLGLVGALLGAPAFGQSHLAPLDEWFPRLRKGMWVKVEGHLQDHEGFRASEIRVMNGELDEIELTTTIADIDAERKLLRTRFGIDVVVTLETEIQSLKRHRASFSSLQPGDRIEAEGTLQKDGTMLAVEIEIKRPRSADQEPDDEITGRIEDLDAATRKLVVLGVPVFLNEKTKNKTPLFE